MGKVLVVSYSPSLAGECCLLPSAKLVESTYSLSLYSLTMLFPQRKVEGSLSDPKQTALVFAKHKQDTRKQKSFKERTKVHVPHLADVAVHQE